MNFSICNLQIIYIFLRRCFYLSVFISAMADPIEMFPHCCCVLIKLLLASQSNLPRASLSQDLSDSVLCDSCIDIPRPAVKSCLTCLVSYCEAHLRPHLENPKFSQHKLLDPLRDIERKTCEVHNEGLLWFCVPDQQCVCEGCMSEDHRGHELRSVEQKKQNEMVKTVTAAENAINKLQNNTVSIENSVMEVRAVVDAQFERLSAALEKTKRSLMELLETEEKQAVKQADGIRVHLENRLSDLRKTQAQVQKISRNKNNLDFLQEYVEWKQEGADTSLPGVYIGLMDSLNSVSKIITDSTDKLCAAMETEFTDRVTEAYESGLGIKTTVRAMVAVKHSQSLPDPQNRADLLQYAKSFTFDLNTAHKFLRLTEENRKVTNTTPWQHAYPDHEERFDHWRQVLAVESIYLDRTYYELDFSGDGTYLGVAYKSIERKGSESNSCLCSTNSSWCVQWTGKSFSAWHSDVEVHLSADSAPRFSRLGVYVDHAVGTLRFYGLRASEQEGETEAEIMLIHEYKAEFREPLYPAFWLSKKENTVTMVTPGEPLKSTSPSPPTTSTTSSTNPNNGNSTNANANNNNNNNGNNANTPPPSSPTNVSTAANTAESEASAADNC
uniref:B30.2/SPRY domain-containing protein n=1 Tax=Periophthalmus magnuspinnatus TaxID=409849 RepID=A0A3B3ZZU3_9GOBI